MGDKKSRISVTKAVDRINSELLSSPGDKKLKKSTIHDAIKRGSFGVSLLKNGRPRIVPPQVTHGLACHAVMMQNFSEGEASFLKMRAIASALTLGRTQENIFSTDYLRQRTRMDHPSMIMPKKAINNKDRCIDWVTYKNIQDWNQKAKEFLVSLGRGFQSRGSSVSSYLHLVLSRK